jgi:hypothetical protein
MVSVHVVVRQQKACGVLTVGVCVCDADLLKVRDMGLREGAQHVDWVQG